MPPPAFLQPPAEWCNPSQNKEMGLGTTNPTPVPGGSPAKRPAKKKASELCLKSAGAKPIRHLDTSDMKKLQGDVIVKETKEKNKMSKALALPPSTTTLPPHLLMASLLEQLCYMYVRDRTKAQKLFKILCEHLSKLNVIAPLSQLDEMSSLRYQHRTMLNKIMKTAIKTLDQGQSLLALPPVENVTHLSMKEDIIGQTSRYRNEFRELSVLGKGGFGSVFKAQHYLDGREYAVKKVRFKQKNVNQLLKLLREVKALAKLVHTNIVGYNAAWMEYDDPYSSSKGTSRTDSPGTQDSISATDSNVPNQHDDASMSIQFCSSDEEEDDIPMKSARRFPLSGGIGLAMSAKFFSRTIQVEEIRYENDEEQKQEEESIQTELESVDESISDHQQVVHDISSISFDYAENIYASGKTEQILTHRKERDRYIDVNFSNFENGKDFEESYNDSLVSFADQKDTFSSSDFPVDFTSGNIGSIMKSESDSISVITESKIQTAVRSLPIGIPAPTASPVNSGYLFEDHQGKKSISLLPKHPADSSNKCVMGDLECALQFQKTSAANQKPSKVNKKKTSFITKEANVYTEEKPLSSIQLPPFVNRMNICKRQASYSGHKAADRIISLDEDIDAEKTEEGDNNNGELVRRKRHPSFGRSISCDAVREMEEVMESRNHNYDFQNSITLYIQMELCSLTLQEWLEDRNGTLHPQNYDKTVMSSDNMRIFHQLLQGVEFIHSYGLIHRDLKPRNVFLSGPNLHVKIGDFGLAKEHVLCQVREEAVYTPPVVSPEGLPLSPHTSGVGTSLYAAPEQLDGNSYDIKSDMYSLGVIMYEMFQVFGTEMERVECIQALRKGSCSGTFRETWALQAEAVDSLTTPAPCDRPSTQDLLNSRLFLSQEQQIKLLQQKVLQQQEAMEQLRKKVVDRDKTIAQLHKDLAKALS